MSFKKNYKKKTEGFTLIELLLYTTLLIGTVIILSSFFIGIERFRVVSENVRLVEDEGLMAISEIQSIISEAKTVLSPLPGQKTNRLVLEFENQTRNPTIISSNEGRVYIKEANSPLKPINSDRVIVEDEGLTFEHLEIDTYNAHSIFLELNLKNTLPKITTGFVPNYKKNFKISVELNKRQTMESFVRYGLILWLDATDTNTLSLSNDRIVEWRDKSGRNHRAIQNTINQRPLYVPSVEGRPGILFSSFEQNLIVSSNTDFNISSAEDSFSAFLWVRNDGECNSSDTTYGNEVFISRQGEGSSQETWWLGCTGPTEGDSNKLNLNFFTETSNFTNLRSEELINDIKWRHVGWIYDGLTQKISLYMDGQILKTLDVEPPSAITSSNPLCLGGYGENCDQYNGHHLLSNIRLYNRTLSTKEIEYLYMKGKDARGWNLD